jgi:hypothetical protein
MLGRRHTTWLSIPALLAGCAVEHGTLDFPNPLFDLHLGPVALPSSTVLRVGGTYLTLSLPFYIPLALLVAVVFIILLLLRRKHEQVR